MKRWERVDEFRKELRSVFMIMQKAFDLKTESARNKHFEYVINYKNQLIINRDTLPFYDEYIDDILEEIGGFEKRYNSKWT